VRLRGALPPHQGPLQVVRGPDLPVHQPSERALHAAGVAMAERAPRVPGRPRRGVAGLAAATALAALASGCTARHSHRTATAVPVRSPSPLPWHRPIGPADPLRVLLVGD